MSYKQFDASMQDFLSRCSMSANDSDADFRYMQYDETMQTQWSPLCTASMHQHDACMMHDRCMLLMHIIQTAIYLNN